MDDVIAAEVPIRYKTRIDELGKDQAESSSQSFLAAIAIAISLGLLVLLGVGPATRRCLCGGCACPWLYWL